MGGQFATQGHDDSNIGLGSHAVSQLNLDNMCRFGETVLFNQINHLLHFCLGVGGGYGPLGHLENDSNMI